MPLETRIICYGLQALVRVGFAAKSSYEQSVRDAAIVLPNILAPVWSEADKVRDVFADPDLQAKYLDDDAKFRALQDLDGDEFAREAALVTLAPIVEHAIRETPVLAKRFGADCPPFGTLQGLIVVKQWQDGRGPYGPWARLGLALGHVVIEAVQLHPAAFGLRGRAELYVQAFTGQLEKILPHPDDPRAPGNDRATRVLAITFQAGFAALAELTDEVIEEDHIRDLVVATVKPLVAQLEEVAQGEARLGSIRDTVLGPVVTAAITTLARNPQAFLGASFAPGTALGMVTATFLTAEIGEGDARNHIKSVFSEDGLVRVTKAALAVVAQRPEIIVGRGDGRSDAFARGFVQRLADSVVRFGPPLDRRTAFTKLAVAALDSLAGSSAIFFDPADPWHEATGKVVQDALGDIAAGLQLAVKPSGAARTDERVRLFIAAAFTEENLVGYVRIYLDQAARTPAMLTGRNAGAELTRIVASVTRALALQEGRLLSLDSVNAIAAVAAEEAARNPARLFRLDPAKPQESLAASLIAKLLGAAAAQLRAGEGRSTGVVLFGDTLEQAIVATLRAASGSAVRAAANQDGLLALVDALNALATRADLPIGREEWLMLFRALVAHILRDPAAVELDADSLLALLRNLVVSERTHR